MKVLPSAKELKQSIKSYYNHKDVSNKNILNLIAFQDLIVYKLVLEILVRYHLEFKGPNHATLRKQVIPFAKYFYKKVQGESLQEINDASIYFKSFYPSKRKLYS